jgi:hypothetical protein
MNEKSRCHQVEIVRVGTSFHSPVGEIEFCVLAAPSKEMIGKCQISAHLNAITTHPELFLGPLMNVIFVELGLREM